ncbi:MAG: PAS domain-containing protein [Acidimicrobiaceae bacterium]|nr:PAS domain-containing protein [Acidimicrobiaceae bacterium]
MTALSRSSLVRFGAAIMAGSALLTGVSFLSAVRQGSALERRNDMAQMSALVKDADKYHDSLRALVYGSALDDLLGPEAAAALADEIPGSAQTFLDIVDEASALDVDSRISDALDAMRPVVERYGASSVGAAAALEALSSAGTTDGIDRDEARAAYDTWVSDFEELAVVLDDELAASVETVGAEIVDDAARAASTAKLLIALSALAAFGLFVAVGVRVLRAVTHMNELQAETERIGSMVENSPTNTMFCDTDLVVRYMNPASLQTLRSIEHLLPCRADDIVGRSIDIFHEDPAHQRRLLGDPDRFLPHSAEIRVGDEIMQLNASAIRDAHGTYIGAMATWSLITDRVRTQQLADAAQERERAAAAELASKVDALSATLAAAAAGDLTARVSVSGDDAIGRMGHAVEKLLGDLRTSIHAIAANSEALAAAAEELQAVAAQMGGNSADTSHQVAKVSDASIEVARYVETVSAASDQMSSSIKEIARNASEAAQVATQAVEAAKVTNQSVAALGESSLEIGQIVKVITGIAQQTNLLALNATIEAARAGEAGKGFAVVANEVKELAKETAKATEDISAKIEAIQTDTTSSVDSITGILTIIDQIAHFQDTIAAAVEEQAATTSEIARSVSEASRGSQEITHNMHTVADAAQSTASGAEDSSRAASELARMATDLQNLVGAFRY